MQKGILNLKQNLILLAIGMAALGSAAPAALAGGWGVGVSVGCGGIGVGVGAGCGGIGVGIGCAPAPCVRAPVYVAPTMVPAPVVYRPVLVQVVSPVYAAPTVVYAAPAPVVAYAPMVMVRPRPFSGAHYPAYYHHHGYR